MYWMGLTNTILQEVPSVLVPLHTRSPPVYLQGLDIGIGVPTPVNALNGAVLLHLYSGVDH